MKYPGDPPRNSVSVIFNERQLQAIEHVHGPMLVVAGAGTGKTTVLVERIAGLIRNHYARPGEILALTFADNAADEMSVRVRKELGGANTEGLRAMTFHAYCYGVLKSAGKSFGVLTKEDLWVYLRQRIDKLPLDRYTRAASPGQFLEALLDFFDRCHDEEVSPVVYRQYVEKLCGGKLPLPRVASSKQADGMPREEVLARCNEIASVFQVVEDMLAGENLGTYAHMITHALELLRNDAQLRAAEQRRSRFLLVDEFQDVNLAQIDLAQLLAGGDQNLFAVGDPDQAIYRFRGASAAAFREFARRFPTTKCVVLADNQRSRTPVLKCAYAVICGNPAAAPVATANNTGKKSLAREPLASARDRQERRQGELLPRFPVDIVVAEDEEQEAFDIARRIEELLRQPERKRAAAKAHRCPRIAVLYRMHFHRDAVVRELSEHEIAFSVVGLNALETPELRDVLACLCAVASTADSGSLFRVAALPMFCVDAEAMRQALSHASKETDFLTTFKTVPGTDEVLTVVSDAAEATKGKKADVVLKEVLRRFRFDPDSPPVNAFRSFVGEWLKKPIAGSGTIAEFLDYMDYFPDAGGIVAVATDDSHSDPNVVRLMTAHAAKGLEFDHVFVLRLNQNSFPTSFKEKLFEFPQQLRRGLVAEGDDKDIHKQEERRLFYVAMTRARETLSLCTRPSRARRDCRPNAFVRDLMDDSSARTYWRQTAASAVVVAVAAGAVAPPAGVGAWLLNPVPDNIMAGPLSATAIESYETCPLQFKMERFWKVPGDIAAAMQYGTLVHTLLRDYYESLRVGRPKSADEVVQLLRDGLAATKFFDPVQRELYEKEGATRVREFVRLRQSEPPRDMIGTERGFEIRIGNVRVKGRVDRIDRIVGNRVAIVDYKTGKPRTQQHADKSLQLSLYALAAREKWNYVAERLVFYNLADNSEVVSKREERHLDEACERVNKAAEQIAAGNFEPTPGFHCGWCAYRSLCPATEERLYQIQAQSAGVS